VKEWCQKIKCKNKHKTTQKKQKQAFGVRVVPNNKMQEQTYGFINGILSAPNGSHLAAWNGFFQL
jgi:DNA gyrase/topoisomerase IV subunit B